MSSPINAAITTIDERTGEVSVKTGDTEVRYSLASAEGFAAASRAWLRATWDSKYVYSFSWLGRPIIQLPEDMIRIQEVIWTLKPDVVIETGIAHGGSLIFYASLFEALHHGRVIGVDIDIRDNNQTAIQNHSLHHRIKMFQGSSIAPEIVDKVAEDIKDDRTVLVILDSNHERTHVLEEIRLYSKFVSVGSYIVVTDGIMEQVTGAPRTRPDWITNNPCRAAGDFLAESTDFMYEEPGFPFNEGAVRERVTYWPRAYLKRVK